MIKATWSASEEGRLLSVSCLWGRQDGTQFLFSLQETGFLSRSSKRCCAMSFESCVVSARCFFLLRHLKLFCPPSSVPIFSIKSRCLHTATTSPEPITERPSQGQGQGQERSQVPGKRSATDEKDWMRLPRSWNGMLG